MFSVVTGSELGGSGGSAAERQLRCGAAGGHILGASPSEELQGFPAVQYRPE